MCDDILLFMHTSLTLPGEASIPGYHPLLTEAHSFL